MSRRLAMVGMAALVLSGCAAGPARTSPAGSGATATPSAATPATLKTAPASPTTGVAPSIAGPSPSVAPSPSTAVTDLPEADQHMYPGTYTPHFRPPLTLTIGSEVELSCVPGFKCRGDVYANQPGWLNIGFGNAPPFELHVERFDKVFDPSHHGRQIDPPRSFARWVEALPGIMLIAPPKRVSIGGLAATQLDVQSGDQAVSFGPIPGGTDPAAFGIGPHQAHRIIVLDAQGHQVMIVVGVVTDQDTDAVTPAQLKAATDFLQPLVDSITWR